MQLPREHVDHENRTDLLLARRAYLLLRPCAADFVLCYCMEDLSLKVTSFSATRIMRTKISPSSNSDDHVWLDGYPAHGRMLVLGIKE